MGKREMRLPIITTTLSLWLLLLSSFVDFTAVRVAGFMPNYNVNDGNAVSLLTLYRPSCAALSIGNRGCQLKNVESALPSSFSSSLSSPRKLSLIWSKRKGEAEDNENNNENTDVNPSPYSGSSSSSSSSSEEEEDLEATVKRKKKNGYRVMDNRDSLPFVVQVVTPDPYTNRERMKHDALLNTKRDREKHSTSNNSTNKNTTNTTSTNSKNVNKKKKKNNTKPIKEDDPLIRKSISTYYNRPHLNTHQSIAASIYTKDNQGTLHQVLGEFKLDKSTNCGDLIEVGEQEFVVQKARCQYKYAGGKRFVMVRKILEVKEVTRIAEESFLKRQLERSRDLHDDNDYLSSLE